jgi:hypothetical protein
MTGEAAPGRLVEARLHLLGSFQDNGSLAREELVRCDVCDELVVEIISDSRIFAEIVIPCDH